MAKQLVSNQRSRVRFPYRAYCSMSIINAHQTFYKSPKASCCVMEILLKLLAFAYAATGIVATIGYFPTIKDLWLHKKSSANIQSYIIWTACGLIVFSYSLFVLPDLLFRIVSGLNFLSCLLILILSLILRHSK